MNFVRQQKSRCFLIGKGCPTIFLCRLFSSASGITNGPPAQQWTDGQLWNKFNKQAALVHRKLRSRIEIMFELRGDGFTHEESCAFVDMRAMRKHSVSWMNLITVHVSNQIKSNLVNTKGLDASYRLLKHSIGIKPTSVTCIHC